MNDSFWISCSGGLIRCSEKDYDAHRTAALCLRDRGENILLGHSTGSVSFYVLLRYTCAVTFSQCYKSGYWELDKVAPVLRGSRSRDNSNILSWYRIYRVECLSEDMFIQVRRVNPFAIFFHKDLVHHTNTSGQRLMQQALDI